MKKIILSILFFAVSVTIVYAQEPVKTEVASPVQDSVVLDILNLPEGGITVSTADGGTLTIEPIPEGGTQFIVTPDPVEEGKAFSVRVGPLANDGNTMIAHISDSEGRIIAADSTKVKSNNPQLDFVAPKTGKYAASIYLGTNSHVSRRVEFTVTEAK